MSLVLAIDEWPSNDQVMWERLQKQGGPLDDRGALAHLRMTSLQTLAQRYGRWLCWLNDKEPKSLDLSAHDRATRERLLEWLEDLAHTKPMTRLMFVDAVLRVVRAAAPDLDWSQQLGIKASLKVAAGRGDPSRKSGRILSSKVLFEAGLNFANAVPCCSTPKITDMEQLRDGAMIAMLALMPMRRRAFADLCLGESFHLVPDKLTVSLSEEMTKTGQPWEADVPKQVEPLLRRYLDEARPLFVNNGDQDQDKLWVTSKGRPFDHNYLGSRIGEKTLMLTGVRVPPHFFRDAAATTLARSSPEHAKLIRPILAHSSIGTAERHYIHAGTIEAGRGYAALIKNKKETRR